KVGSLTIHLSVSKLTVGM
ncbi:transketolase, thiamine diphosphate binding domain protein, partial [Vibrio parahaemolyticus V-223/04]